MAYFVRFLTDLFDSGCVRVPLVRDGSTVLFDSLRAQEILASRDKVMRFGMAHDAPPFLAEAALHGAVILFLAAQRFIDRSAGMAPLHEAIASVYALDRSNVSVVYSVDLALSFLPGLYRNAVLLSEEDELTLTLRQLARKWPLSSIGVPGVEVRASPSFLGNAALAQLYVDRLLEADDASRLHADLVMRVRQSLGAYDHDLAGPNVMAALEAAGCCSALAPEILTPPERAGLLLSESSDLVLP